MSEGIKNEEFFSWTCHRDVSELPQKFFQKLLEWHFDVFGLIEKGLAIDLNTIK